MLIRSVVQTAYNIPQELAYQNVDSQAAVINRTLNVANLQNKGFVDNLIQRYLVQYDLQQSMAGSSGLPPGTESLGLNQF